MQDGFWGIKSRSENGRSEAYVEELKKDDAVLFYLVGAKGSSFLGTCVLDSEFTKLDTQASETLMHRDFLDWHEGVFLREISKWGKPLSIESLRGKDSFVPVGKKIGAFFQGYIKKIKRKEDFEIILREHELSV